MKDWKEGWKTHRERSQRRFYLKYGITFGAGCALLALLALGHWIKGAPLPRKAAEYGPFLFILFAGLAALSLWRWKHSKEEPS